MINTKALFWLYILLLNTYNNKLISGQLNDFINTNRMAQHVLTFTTLFIIILMSNKEQDIMNILISTIGLYALFLLSTKTNLTFSLLILGGLFVLFAYDTILKYYKKTLKKDKIIDDDDKLIIRDKYNYKLFIINNVVIGLIVIGSIYYFITKSSQYNNYFDIEKFLFEKGKRYE